MNIRELALNLIENDRTGDLHLITLEESSLIIGDLIACDDGDGDLPPDLTPEAFRSVFNDELTIDVAFLGGEGRNGKPVNYMYGRNFPNLYAEVQLPFGAGETYGYGELKHEIIRQAEENGYDVNRLRFWYDDSGAPSCEISVDNGRSVCTPAEAVERMPWEVIVNAMDDETREAVAREGIDDNAEFLTRYLEIAPFDITVG